MLFRSSWELVTEEALQRRPELQRQNLAVKKRELELVAAKNYLKPQLDAVGRYRVRGFGDTFAGGGVASGGAPDTSLGNLGTGDHQEWRSVWSSAYRWGSVERMLRSRMRN